MKFNITIFFAALALLMTACSTIDCSLDGRILCHYAMQSSDGESAELTYPLSVTFIREAADSDTIFINKESTVSTLDIPMSNVAAVDKMIFQLDVDSALTLRDTLSIFKTNTPRFESVDCAARYSHEITKATSTHNFIDTLIINNAKVSNDATVTNIYIRLHTDTL